MSRLHQIDGKFGYVAHFNYLLNDVWCMYVLFIRNRIIY